MAEEHTLEVCPVCGRSELYFEVGGYIGKIYHCKHCGYIGPVVLLVSQETGESLQKRYDQEHPSRE